MANMHIIVPLGDNAANSKDKTPISVDLMNDGLTRDNPIKSPLHPGIIESESRQFKFMKITNTARHSWHTPAKIYQFPSVRKQECTVTIKHKQ